MDYNFSIFIDPTKLTFETDQWAIFIGIAQIVILIVSVFLVLRQIRQSQTHAQSNHEWEKKKATLDFNFSMINNPLWAGENARKYGVDIFDGDETYEQVYNRLEDDDKIIFKQNIDSQISILATMAVNIKNEVLNEKICYEDCILLFIYFHKFCKDYIDEMQTRDPILWRDFTDLVTKWNAQYEKEKQALLQNNNSV